MFCDMYMRLAAALPKATHCVTQQRAVTSTGGSEYFGSAECKNEPWVTATC